MGKGAAVGADNTAIVIPGIGNSGGLIGIKIALHLIDRVALVPGATVGGIEQFKSVALLGKIKA